MSFVTTPSTVHTIRESDPNFRIRDGMIIYPRAMLHVSPECPHHISEMISLASSKGWLKCVAHVTEREMLFIGLTQDA